MQTPSFIACWSAHGGVGRTLAVWGVGRVLAARGLRVLLVDLDLEAPGLTRIAATDGEGIVEWAASRGDAQALVERCVAIGEGLRVLPAGRLGADIGIDWTGGRPRNGARRGTSCAGRSRGPTSPTSC
ncbi:hypothetical protein OV079_15720 [Nannocystis pusilla]|uniref:CobQ/CobB/MinD/ParA nucleotide binding domain-containing protein n=1 Tax=Nannocystis pusilla TaxID=889268 RepID=A0A9X3EMW6_9BACT|nr:hypothetical protein [Nannocystis pusilla]MCY1006979.1 hypothetical protein [Nannocystis pusilla]